MEPNHFEKKQEKYGQENLNSVCRLLYYPYISIPNAAWLTQAILYWDGLASIVPVEYLKHPHRFSRFSRELVRAGIIQTVQPEEYAYSYVDKYMSFLEWVEENRNFFLLDLSANNSHLTKQYNLHAGKLGYIGSELEKLGVAKRVDEEWYMTNENLSMAFMTFLAILIGQEDDYIPMTDSYRGMSALFDIGNKTPSHAARSIRSDLRNSILDGLLPVPYGIQDLSNLLRFKEKYHNELIRFRRRVEDFIMTLENTPEELRKIRMQSFLLDSQEEIDEIKGHMGYFHAPEIDLGTLIAAFPTVAAATNGDFVGAALGVVSLFGEMVWNRDRNRDRNKALAYAALYQSRFSKYRANIDQKAQE